MISSDHPCAMKAWARFSSRRNTPVPVSTDRTQPPLLKATRICPAGRRSVELSAASLRCLLHRPASFATVSFRVRRLSLRALASRPRGVPMGVRLETADVGVARLEQALAAGVSTCWG